MVLELIGCAAWNQARFYDFSPMIAIFVVSFQ